MRIGVPKEIKNKEYRVGLLPTSVSEFCKKGHTVFVESNAGAGIGFTNDDYKNAGAEILLTAQEVFQNADMIIKVKEPQPIECKMLKENQILFTFLHLAPDPKQAKALMASKCIAIAYETVTDNFNGLPLLAPMSEIAGRMSAQVGAWMLEKKQGGKGVLLGGVPGVSPGKVTILGGGIAGENAASIALGMGADVTIFDININRLRQLNHIFQGKVKTLYSTTQAIEKSVIQSDLVIGAVLVVGASAPKLVTKEMVNKMEKGSVLVDIAIDQGGCFETSQPTTHDNPFYDINGVMHYCVTNMPGAVAKTAAQALNNATLPYALNIANNGIEQALQANKHLQNGINVYKGHITHKCVAKDLNLPYNPYQ